MDIIKFIIKKIISSTSNGRSYNMTVRDLYVNTDENQEFIMWFESEPSKAFYKGKLENCPSELMYMLVDKFKAIDFNTIEVVLIG